MSYWAQSGEKGKTDVVVVLAPLEIVSRYESPFRTAGMNPGLITTSCLAALELAPEAGLERPGQTYRTCAHRGGARQGSAQTGALPGIALRRKWRI